MKKLFLLVLSAAFLSGLTLAQDDPMVDITALSMGTGTIAGYLTDAVGQDTTCALQFEAIESGEETQTSFSCLLEAVAAAGLVETLSAEDASLTVFAPTDMAFYNFAQNQNVDSPEALFADTEALTSILTYHVAPDAGSLNDMFVSKDANAEVFTALMTAQGSELPIDFPTLASGAEGDEAVVSLGEAESLGQAYVTGTTISVDNGYIIPINEVLMPPMAE